MHVDASGAIHGPGGGRRVTFVPGGCVDPSVDGVTTGPCWSSAVVVWRVLVDGETASPAHRAGVGVGQLADGGRAGVKRAGMVRSMRSSGPCRRGRAGRIATACAGPQTPVIKFPRLVPVCVPPRGCRGEPTAVSWSHDPRGKTPTPLGERLRPQARRVLTARRRLEGFPSVAAESLVVSR